MKEITDWLLIHWPELVAALGIGSGSAIGTKKLIDKNQNVRLDSLESKTIEMEKAITKLETDIETNTKFDKQFREQINQSMSEVKNQLDRILDHLLKSKN